MTPRRGRRLKIDPGQQTLFDPDVGVPIPKDPVYSSASRTLYVNFVDGTPWRYYDVNPNEWRNFRRSASPGRFINRVLNSHNYERGEH